MAQAQAPVFAELLKRYRVAAGLTQDALAERSSLSIRTISDLERGVRRSPHRDTAVLLADALGLGARESPQLVRTPYPRRQAQEDRRGSGIRALGDAR